MSTLIPQRLDDPPKLLLWEMDQAMVFMSILVIGIACDLPGTFFVLGLLVAWRYGKLKSGKHRGFAKHLIFWRTPITLGMRRTPPSYIREFLG